MHDAQCIVHRESTKKRRLAEIGQDASGEGEALQDGLEPTTP